MRISKHEWYPEHRSFPHRFHSPAELSTNSLGNLVVFWNYDIQTVFHTQKLSTNSLGDFVLFWNYDIQTVFHAVELSTNSLRASGV